MKNEEQTSPEKTYLNNTADRQRKAYLQEMNSGLAAALFKLTEHDPVRVIPYDLQEEPLVILDLTDENESLQEIDISNPAAFSRYIAEVLDEAGAHVGIGKYDEDRSIYRHSSLFDEGDVDAASAGADAADAVFQQVRSLHLGMDLWVAAGTEVFPAFPGTVHSFQDNAAEGDYGPAIILEHHIDELKGISHAPDQFSESTESSGSESSGSVSSNSAKSDSSDLTGTFYTLYGHLSRESLKGLKAGQSVTPKTALARVGRSSENGSWPPHLHFQIIQDLQGKSGDYPGVCAVSDRAQYTANCPDPDIVLHLPEQRIIR